VLVTVALPAVLSCDTEGPGARDKSGIGRQSRIASLEVTLAVSVTVLIKFQLASTALTVTLKEAPAVCAVGVPVLPVVLPGAAV